MLRFLRIGSLVWMGCLLTMSWAVAESDSLPSSQGTIVLTISGAIQTTNAPESANFDRSMLEALPQHEFSTQSPWTEGSHLYQGVLLSDILARVGASGKTLVARALNDYHTTIDLDAIAQYPVLLAMKADGRTMRVRDKGPLWLLYPMTDFPELNTTVHQSSMIWQLRSLEVK